MLGLKHNRSEMVAVLGPNEALPIIYTDARPHVCGVFLMFLMFTLTLVNGLCYAWFIYPILCLCWRLEIGTSSIDWAQVTRFHLKTKTESSLQNVVF
jgi:hypothetical protein